MMNSTQVKCWPSILVIVGSAILMQWHSIGFWIDQTGLIGLAWSLAIEGVALWFWWQRKTLLAVTASLLLIAGPLHELSSPLLEELQNGDHRQQLIEINQTEINQLTASIEQYQNNSAARIGWSGRIDRTQKALDNARKQIKALMSQDTGSLAWRSQAIIAVQVLVLFVVMTGQIQAVISLRGITVQPVTRKTITKSLSEKPKQVTKIDRKPVDFDQRVQTVIDVIHSKLQHFMGRQKLLANYYNFRPADVSMVLNHFERVELGKEIIAEKALKRMELAFGTISL